jgi:GDP-L-fucose synthase
MDKHARIFITGHRGSVGSAITRRLQAGGHHQLPLRTRQTGSDGPELATC